MDERDRDHIRVAIESAYVVQTYVASAGPDWRENGMAVDAICKRIEEVGQNMWKISDELQALHPEIPWRRASGMRHAIAHDYGAIDIAILVRVSTEDLPALVEQLEQLLESE
jgi:uncharacterized protein with HEPN domain